MPCRGVVAGARRYYTGTKVVHMRQLAFERAFPQRNTLRRRWLAPWHQPRQSLDPVLSVPAGINPFEYGARHAEAQVQRLASQPVPTTPPVDARKLVVAKEKRLHLKQARWLKEVATRPSLMRLPGSDAELPTKAAEQPHRQQQNVTWRRWQEHRRRRGLHVRRRK